MSTVSSRRCAIYLRVSTNQQNHENQRPDCEAAVAQRGLTVVEVYDEVRSGRDNHRPEWCRMLRDAERGRFDTLVVWALDRFGRDMLGIEAAVARLAEAGVELLSVKEPWWQTTGPVAPIILRLLAWVAEQESVRRAERVRIGLARAKREGKRCGRPRRGLTHPAEIADARSRIEAGESQVSVARAYGVSPKLLRGRLAAAGSVQAS